MPDSNGRACSQVQRDTSLGFQVRKIHLVQRWSDALAVVKARLFRDFREWSNDMGAGTMTVIRGHGEVKIRLRHVERSQRPVHGAPL